MEANLLCVFGLFAVQRGQIKMRPEEEGVREHKKVMGIMLV
jgi:hypothetical protein